MRIRLLCGMALLAGVGLVGCTAHTPEARAEAAKEEAAEDELELSLREYHQHHHRGGVSQFVAMSLDTLGTDETRAPQVTALQAELVECMAPVRDLESKLLLVVADGVASGTVSTEGMEDSMVRLAAAVETMRACRPEVMDRLHGVLSSAEREALVDKVQAHFAVWREVNEAAEGPSRGTGERLGSLTIELGLTTSQEDQLATALDKAREDPANRFKPKDPQAFLDAFSTAFVKESFEARTLTPDANVPLVIWGARRMARFYETVTPLLTPEQRDTLATRLRAHANHETRVSSRGENP